MKIRQRENQDAVREKVTPAYIFGEKTPAAYIGPDGYPYSAVYWEEVPEPVDRDVTSESQFWAGENSLRHNDGVAVIPVLKMVTGGYRLEKVTCWEISELMLLQEVHEFGKFMLRTELQHAGAKEVTRLKLVKRESIKETK